MRRFLTTLAILLVVLVAGMTALVMLVNPNDFRAYMVKQVEARSGYQLRLDGDLRWHVWPQLSILSGGMALSAPGADAPVVSAENMRLDVKLWPLLSHKLVVKQVMLKGAVIRLTPDSEVKPSSNAPIAPPSGSTPAEGRGWQLDIDKLRIADSLLILQRSDDEEINVRDIDLLMAQDGNRQVHIELSSRINRDQRDILFSLAANMDMAHFPQQVNANIEKLEYQLQGADIPGGGISGKGSLQASYQRQPEKITLSQLALSANESQLTGSGSATLGDIPDYVLDLKSDKIDLDALLGSRVAAQKGSPSVPGKAGKPVISSEQQKDSDGGLAGFSARFSLQADALVYRSLDIRQFVLQATNQQGVLNVATLSGKLGEGRFSLPGKMDAKASPAIMLQPEVDNMDIASLTTVFALPETLSGKFSMNGQFSGNSLTLPAITRQWQGKAAVKVTDLRLQGLNIHQMVQMAVARGNSSVQGMDRYERYTEVRLLTGNVQLNAGKLRISDLNGSSEFLSLTGNGQLDLLARTCDSNLGVRVLQGWHGDEQLIKILQNTAIPLRIYGPWDKLSYQLQVEQLLRKRLQDEMKRRLNEWADKNNQSQKGKDLKQLLNRL
ncbi:outer membrane assembly protein AsmA [Brenneria sp. 4F2]|nr:outer membrane assembly protein AsmA [Brenneria bubanii]